MPDDVPRSDVEEGPTRRRLLLAGLSGLSLAACSPGATPTAKAGPASAPTTPPTTPRTTPTTSDTAATPRPSAPTPTGPPRLATTPGPDITHGPRGGNSLALTFHGQGPLTLARDILRSAARAEASITVFAVGTWLDSNPEIGPEIVGAGHELGNHTWSHQQMKQLSASEATREAVRGARALVASVGTRGLWFRPSGTQHSTATIRAAAHAAGYQRCVSYDVDPEDFRDPGAQAVRDRTLAAARPGSIVSLHFGHAGTVEALPAILAGLAAKGLRPVTLSQLLADA